MTVIANRRSVMTLFSDPTDPWSHRTRLVLAEKSVNIDYIDVQHGNLPEDLLDLNPYNSVPTLVDRELVLYDSRVIVEYLDERFPHPPLMPVDPVTRAQYRLYQFYRIERDWLLTGSDRKSSRARDRQKQWFAPTQVPAGQHCFPPRKFHGQESSFSATSFPWSTAKHRAHLLAAAGVRDRAAPHRRRRSFAIWMRCSSRPSFQFSLTELEQEMRE